MPRGRKATEFTQPMTAIPLDAAEQARKAHELAEVNKEIDKISADAAAAASDARKKVRTLNNRRRVLQECVLTGMEMKPSQLEFDSKPKAGDGGWPAEGQGNGHSPSKKSRGKSVDA